MKVIQLHSKRSNVNLFRNDSMFLEYTKTTEKQRGKEIAKQLTKGYLKLLSNY